MSYEHEIESIEDEILTVAVKGWDDGYVLWQRGLTKEVGSEDGVYFEYDGQIMVATTTSKSVPLRLMVFTSF